MEAGRARRKRDDSRLPTLSVGLSSVRLIINKLETEYTRVVAPGAFVHRELVKYDPNCDEGYHDDSLLVQPRGRVWNQLAINLAVALSRCIPSVTFGNFGVLAVTTGLFAPKMISYLVVYPFCRLVFGTLYPAYASYKAVRTKNLKEYVKWMMYWIVFALFTCTETFTDVFLSWFPFYYEVKIVLVLWLLSPATKGSSILYRKFVHPALCRREQEIDEYIAKAKDQGYHTVLNLGTKGVNYATTVIMQTAIKGGGGLVQQLRKSYSLSDLTECEPREERGSDEADDVLTEPRLIRRGGKSGFTTRRSASESNSRAPMYFPEVDVDVRGPRPNRSDEPDFSHIKSTEDISSGYSSADNSASLTRTASLGASARARGRSARTTVTTIKRPQAAEESEVITEEPHDDDTFEYANMPPLVNLQSPLYLSHTDPPFLYQYVGDQVKIVQVLGNYPINTNSNNETNNSDHRHQKEVTAKEASLKDCEAIDLETQDDVLNRENDNKEYVSNILEQKLLNNQEPEHFNSDASLTMNETELKEISETECISIIVTDVNSNTNNNTNEREVATIVDDHIETTSPDTSINDIDTAESDDEASFGTPENSPKSKRKSPKGKYGKDKAPPPPKTDQEPLHGEGKKTDEIVIESATSQESFIDIINKLPDRESGLFKGLQLVNPIAEKKRRHKSKSPGKMHKVNTSSIGKLLQLPSKLAFWQKKDDESQSDNDSTSSEGNSRRSSTVEKTIINEFQSSTDLNTLMSATGDFNKIPQIDVTDDQISFIDAVDVDSENINQYIIEKSVILQKLIDAKLETHPEYKYVSLHEEMPSTSKSTDV